MVRFPPGVYTIVNRYAISTDWKSSRQTYILDNQKFYIAPQAQITIEVDDTLILENASDRYYFAYQISTKESVVGNVAAVPSG
jgi:hypothetical protein